MTKQDHIRYTPRDGFHSQTALMDLRCENPECYESCWKGGGDLGVFHFSKAEIRPGFDIWTSDCLFRENINFSLADQPAVFNFGFCLSGKFRSKYGTNRNSIEISSGKQGVFYNPYTHGMGRMSMDVPQRQVEIVFSPDRLRSYLESDMNAIHPVLRSILEEKQNNQFFQIRTITPAMRNALEQLLDCPYGGLTRKLFFESRALELLALQLRQLSDSSPKRVSNGFRLHQRDRKRTESARDFLISRLDNPPGLGQLAREAGMSHPKLNRCFREMYGMTVFEYLRNERLNRAKKMLDQGLNVTETAYAVGYDSISHFSKAFKNRFGALPSRCV